MTAKAAEATAETTYIEVPCTATDSCDVKAALEDAVSKLNTEVKEQKSWSTKGKVRPNSFSKCQQLADNRLLSQKRSFPAPAIEPHVVYPRMMWFITDDNSGIIGFTAPPTLKLEDNASYTLLFLVGTNGSLHMPDGATDAAALIACYR